MTGPTSQYRFGRFSLVPAERRLLADGEPQSIGPRAFDVLIALVRRAGQLVTKSELLDQVWPGLVVEENNLQVQVSALRKILGPDAIATVAGKGYRFAPRLEPGGESPLAPSREAPAPRAAVLGRGISISSRARSNPACPCRSNR